MNAYNSRSKELASWAMSSLVNRTDVWGSYLKYHDDSVGPITMPPKKWRGTDCLTENRLVSHFESSGPTDIVGLHTGSPCHPDVGSRAKWIAVDIDVHTEESCRSSAGPHWYGVLRRLGYSPLMTESNGKGGIHLRLIFDNPIRLSDAFKFGKWLTRDWKEWFAEPVETFPKQPSLSPVGESGQYGNWLRLPGKHPKRDYWSTAWDSSRGFVGGEEAVSIILKSRGESPDALHEAIGDWETESPVRREIPPIKHWVDYSGQTPYGKAALAATRRRVAEAGPNTRNISLNKAAYSLGRLVSVGHLDRATVESALSEAATYAGLEPGEIKATIRSGIEAGLAEGSNVPLEKYNER